MARFGDIYVQYFDNSGKPLSAGQLYFYESGSSTPKDTYSDIDQTIPNPNPFVFDAAGRQTDIFFSGSARVELKDSDDVLIQELDPIGDGTTVGQWEPWVSARTYDRNDIVIGSDERWYVSTGSGNLNNDPTLTIDSWMEISFINEYVPTYSYSIDNVSILNGVLYVSLQDFNVNNKPDVSPTWWKAISSTSALPTGAQDGDAAIWDETLGAWVPVPSGRRYRYWRLDTWEFNTNPVGSNELEWTQLIMEENGVEVQSECTLNGSDSPQFGTYANLVDGDKFTSRARFLNPVSNSMDLVFDFGDIPRNISAIGQVPWDIDEGYIAVSLWASDDALDWVSVCRWTDLPVLPPLNQSGKYYVIWDGENPDPWTVKEAPQDSTEYVRQDKGWVPNSGGTGLPEAPQDATPYGRQDATWVHQGYNFDTTEKIADWTAVAFYYYFANIATASNLVMTLPAAPTIGDRIGVRLSRLDEDELTINGNGNNIDETSAPLVLDASAPLPALVSVELIFLGAPVGWSSFRRGNILA